MRMLPRRPGLQLRINGQGKRKNEYAYFEEILEMVLETILSLSLSLTLTENQ